MFFFTASCVKKFFFKTQSLRCDFLRVKTNLHVKYQSVVMEEQKNFRNFLVLPEGMMHFLLANEFKGQV